jgi:hypothetical protein
MPVTAQNWTNVSDFGGMLAIANDNTGGYFWASMMFMIFIVSFFSMIGFGFEVALLSSAFAGLIIGILLAYMDLVAWSWVVMFAGITILSFIWIMYNQKEY